MIDRREILGIATQTSLTPHVVEKDYVLGWMLAGIYAHEELCESWLFKGGTCLKKCFFETYRFSEDLDFTLINEAHLEAGFLKRVFGEIGEWIYEQTGIEVPAAKQEFDVYLNPRGKTSCQGKISYKGPVSSPHGLPRIKLDLTADERVVLPLFWPKSSTPTQTCPMKASRFSLTTTSRLLLRSFVRSQSGPGPGISMTLLTSIGILTPGQKPNSSLRCCVTSVPLKALSYRTSLILSRTVVS